MDADFDVTAQTLQNLVANGLLTSPMHAFLAREEHRKWFSAQCATGNPVYILLPDMADFLADALPAALVATTLVERCGGRIPEGKRATTPLLSAQDATVEKAFHTCCRAIHPDAVGFWDGAPIIHARLSETHGMDRLRCLLKELIAGGEDAQGKCKGTPMPTPIQVDQAIDVLREEVRHVERLLRIRAATLVCDEEFVADRNALQGLWAHIPSKVFFPLTRLVRESPPPGWDMESAPPEATLQFFGQLRGFLDKWELVGMATWDLPDPMGFMDAAPVTAHWNQLGYIQAGRLHPRYWTEMCANLDASVARLVLPGALDRPLLIRRLLDDLSEPETLYCLRFAELAVRSRYGARSGCVERVVQAFIRCHGGSESYVGRLRSRYAWTLR